MEIYELRAYIGESQLIYTALFSTLNAAREKAEELRTRCAEMQIQSTISRLSLVGEEYSLSEYVCTI